MLYTLFLLSLLFSSATPTFLPSGLPNILPETALPPPTLIIPTQDTTTIVTMTLPTTPTLLQNLSPASRPIKQSPYVITPAPPAHPSTLTSLPPTPPPLPHFILPLLSPDSTSTSQATTTLSLFKTLASKLPNFSLQTLLLTLTPSYGMSTGDETTPTLPPHSLPPALPHGFIAYSPPNTLTTGHYHTGLTVSPITTRPILINAPPGATLGPTTGTIAEFINPMLSTVSPSSQLLRADATATLVKETTNVATSTNVTQLCVITEEGVRIDIIKYTRAAK